MTTQQKPTTAGQLADALKEAAGHGHSIQLGGSFTKERMSRAPATPGVVISTAGLDRVVQYNPRDLTIGVEAGLRFSELSRILAGHRQMIPLDPPYFDDATVGGVVASNASGPRRRLYGTARDFVIGMSFITLEGKLVKSGGMVVKNVAGLDMAKLMIGSFGTLAAITSVNFKTMPMPPQSRTFLLSFDDAPACVLARNRVLGSVLQPGAIDILNPAAARQAGLDPAFVLAIQAGGSSNVLDRYQRELPEARVVDGGDEQRFWTAIREFTPAFVASHPHPQVVRVSSTLQGVADVLESFETPFVARAGSGVCYGYFDDAAAADAWTERVRAKNWRYVFEYGESRDSGVFGGDFEVLRRVKEMFDPGHLLNPGRLYGRL